MTGRGSLLVHLLVAEVAGKALVAPGLVEGLEDVAHHDVAALEAHVPEQLQPSHPWSRKGQGREGQTWWKWVSQ